MSGSKITWTKTGPSTYRFNETDYEVFRSEHAHGTSWYICHKGKIIESVAAEPSREHAGYAIKARLMIAREEAARGVAS
jgi:hypothetical protein